ncbi:MAG: CapA family protein [Clostridia bacterium]|nr:CapA family protein [Clostridia bacterium]MBR1827800.1 CapA family protein [Clostridia bacterium]
MKQNSNRQPQRRQSASNRRTATERQRRQNTAQAKRAAAQRRKASAQRRKTSGRRRTQSSMRQRRTITIIAAVALALIAIILLVIGLRSCGSLDKKTDTAKEDTAVVQQDGRVTGKPAKATILSSGDYLIHKMILDSVRTGNGYDFDSIFTNVKDEITAADYAVCNFEFTITETGNFSFYPHFKLPPETADALKNAGFDFLVTANNHSGDDREDGIYRTVKILRQKGFKTTGTFETPDEKKYSVVDVNGIKVGIVNYTFGTIDDQGLKALNGNYALDANASQCINVFQNEKLPQLYSELEQITADMKKDGAEAYIAYMHWGNEFQLQQTTTQQEIAQKLCDLGYNAIIGGHPHVIQPAAVLTGSNGNKTFCIYSTGNMVSNQRREYMSASPNGYTEDAIFVYTTFERDSEGNVKLASVDYTPLWMNKSGSSYKLEICKGDNLTASQQSSKNRTDGLVAEGFSAWNG